MGTGKKYLIIAVVAAVVTTLVVAILFLYPSEESSVGDDGNSWRGLSSLPVDAAAVFSFERFDSALEILDGGEKSLIAEIAFGQSKLKPLFDLLKDATEKMKRRDEANLKSLLSLHYSAQNELSALMIIPISGTEKSIFETELRSGGATAYARAYNGVSLSRYRGVEYFISDTLFIASASSLTIESSIRHLNSRASIMDNEDFIALYKKRAEKGNRLFVNHTQTGKIFSGLADRNYLKYSDFISRFTAWSVYEITTSADRFALTGTLTNNKGSGNYSHIFGGAAGSGSKVASLLPAGTYSLLTFSVKDMEMLSEKYGDYIKYYRRYNEESWKRASDWFRTLNAKELSLAAIPYGGRFEYVTIIKRPGSNFISRIFGRKRTEVAAEEFRAKGYISTLFGGIFSLNEETTSIDLDGWTIIGSEGVVEEFRKGSFNLFTMEEYLSQTKMDRLLSDDKSLLSVIINGSEYPDSLISVFRRDNRIGIESVNRDKNLRIFSFNLYNDKEKGVTVKGSYYADSVKVMPHPVRTDPNGGVLGWELDTVVNIPKGPFELVNFTNGEKEYLTQLNNNWLSLSDKNMRGLWSAPFQEPIKGFVEQIDLYDNGRLQMLFATTNQLHLLDRTGRFISSFPKNIDYNITLGPKLYNLRGETSPAVMLLHTDNTLRLYDKQGVSRSWANITTEETIKEFPELIEIEGHSYWILRTAVKCMIYSVDGVSVTETTGSKRLKRDTEIIPIEGSKVKVTSISGTDYRLDLITGKMDRRL